MCAACQVDMDEVRSIEKREKTDNKMIPRTIIFVPGIKIRKNRDIKLSVKCKLLLFTDNFFDFYPEIVILVKLRINLYLFAMKNPF